MAESPALAEQLLRAEAARNAACGRSGRLLVAMCLVALLSVMSTSERLELQTSRRLQSRRPKLDSRDHYRVLGLYTDATESQIKTAFRRLAVKWHPDKNPEDREDATIKFNRILEAYEVLSNPEKRAMYDRLGAEGMKQAMAPTPEPDLGTNDFWQSDQWSLLKNLLVGSPLVVLLWKWMENNEGYLGPG
eukprot:gnl/TRDRNA2_/TRDRNA2_186939_c0_seq1.p1 gnl/TRDRNA2_/TRDRNA2_186939_c0~~gnl/TRDRNA2_/TRDRNA2_186939_c0_seq1.p1  ORF type:complete len:190 (+),score=31.30 gnl/TRDRNA2_/TRDRNA2_186939_c0_seq1:80-649(+)